MALYTVSSGQTINAADINQFANRLQAASGATESSKYYLLGNGNANLANISQYMQSQSKGSTPVSVTIDTADQAPAFYANSPSTQNLSSNGFVVFLTTSAPSLQARAAGNWTIQY